MAPYPIESLVLEFLYHKEKWLYVCMYSPHSKYKIECVSYIENVLSQANAECFSSIYIIRDLNINMMSNQKSKCLRDVLDVYGMKNVINSPTCFKSQNPTLIDVILTNNARRVNATINTNTGVSDFHHLVGFSTKLHVPRPNRGKITHRSYKHFEEENFRNDVMSIPFQVAEIFNDINDSNCFFSHFTR